jgi:hypothetical protein
VQRTNDYRQLEALHELGALGAQAAPAVPHILAAVARAYREAPEIGPGGKPVITSEAIRTLKAIGPGAVPPLVRALDRGDSLVRYVAASAIAGMDPPPAEALPALAREAVRLNGDTKVRFDLPATMLDALASYGEDAVPVARKYLQHDERYVRLAGLDLIARLGARGAPLVPLIIQRFEEGDKPEQESALEALAAIGPPARDAIPALERARRSPPRDVNPDLIERALQKIRSPQ